MSEFRAFFENLDFSFGQDIVQKEIVFSNNEVLTKKVKNNIYLYKAPENVNTSFYFFDTLDLNDDELFELKRYIWNEDKSEFFFYPNSENIISLYYAKSNPLKDEEKTKIASFKGQDNDEIDKIRKWNFETGTFWLFFEEFTKKIKENERVDYVLINRLKDLKAKLLGALGQDKTEEVQALIDRTLFIKFLEDNHIINSSFYDYYFDNENITFKHLLAENKPEKINLLFEKINEIFDNVLFNTPHIEDQYIVISSKYIYNAISGEVKGQLSLFDFQFNIIPIEFISHIYEVFLEDKQAKEGIYYTPPKLAQLIIDDTITKQGKVLDPACGSGMFLILAFRKMLNDINSSNNKNVSEKIKARLKLLKENIFGIEKQYTAWRLSIFALYLEIFNGLHPDDIKEFITQKIKNGNIKIFEDFSSNIINGNSLEVIKDKIHFKNKTFDYIIGNPPFLQVSKSDDEIEFFNKYKLIINNKEYSAKKIIGRKQISQAFMLKIKDWANNNTKFGFVLNSSNFYSEGKSINFQEFFFEHYQIKNFYELSRVKKILFNKASESVIVAIFNNKQVANNTLNYYPVDLELFSETFNILVIKEDNKIEIKQQELLNRNITLRALLVGNEFDLSVINKIRVKTILLKEFTKIKTNNKKTNYYVREGLKIVGEKAISKHYNLTKNEWNSLNRNEQLNYFSTFKQIYLNNEKNNIFKVKFIQPRNLFAFQVIGQSGFMKNDISLIERSRDVDIYNGDKILWARIGSSIKACYVKQKLYFDFDIHVIKIENPNYYNIITAILNSDIVNYLVNHLFRKRVTGSFPKISNQDILNIPIPSELDNDLAQKISKISRKLTDVELKYEGKIKEELNELIYDLYDLNYLERQRIKDFFAPKRKVKPNDLEKYKETLLYTLEMYFENKPKIEYSIDLNFGFNMIVIGVFFNNKAEMPKTEKVLKFRINEIMQQTNNNLFAMREFLFGKDCIYIIIDRQLKNWTETKAYEDGKLILKHLS